MEKNSIKNSTWCNIANHFSIVDGDTLGENMTEYNLGYVVGERRPKDDTKASGLQWPAVEKGDKIIKKVKI